MNSKLINLGLALIMGLKCLNLGAFDLLDLSLKESFELSLKANQNDLANKSLLDQTEEEKKIIKAKLLPVLSGRAALKEVDSVSPTDKSISLNLSHTLYRGGRDSLAIESADKNTMIAKNQSELDRLNLYLNVIQAYYNYFLNYNDYQNLELLKKLSKERVGETEKRVQVGRSRRGELYQAEAQLAASDAQLSNGEGLLKESQKRFSLLIGYSENENKGLGVKKTTLLSNWNLVETRPLKSYLEEAFNRPDVKIKILKLEQAKIEMTSSKALNYPIISFDSNYYLNKRNGSLKKSDWDMGLSLSIPFYDGGANRASIAESSLKKDQIHYQLLDLKNNLEIDISGKYEIFHRYLDQVKAFDLAFLKTKKSYDESIKDYRLGLISILDVLGPLNLYLDSKRNSESTKIKALLNLEILKASVGIYPQ